MTATFTMPLRVVSEANAREHWATKARRVKRQRAFIALVWAAQGHPRNRKPVSVTLTRLAPRTLDSDNLAGAFKAVRDEVALLCGFDDADPACTWLYGQERAKEYGVRCEIKWAP